MEQTGLKKAFIQLHLSVMLAGFTGLFGKLVTLNETTLTWYRLVFTTMILLVFTGLPRIEFKKFLKIAGCGTLLGLHWILFYASIKASNVSIGVVSFASICFFTSIFEPMILRKRFSIVDMLLALITIVGLACIFSFDTVIERVSSSACYQLPCARYMP